MPQPILPHSSYRPARGGHAPGDLRDAFLEGIEAFAAWRPGQPEPSVEVREQAVPLSALCGLLWNCSDAMPRLDQQQLEEALPQRFFGEDREGTCGSYARAARAMREAITAAG